MKLAVMQPYLFPYLGYFQLIRAVDAFVVFDSANYIKGGWINRNYILSKSEKKLITLPLHGASSNKQINQISLVSQHKILESLRHNYHKAPQFNAVYPILEDIFAWPEMNLARFLEYQLRRVCEYLGLSPKWFLSSRLYGDDRLRGQERILSICKELGASHYVNAPGGKALYDQMLFAVHGVHLSFIQPRLMSYSQFGSSFVPNLSIIDVMMFNHPEQCAALLDKYDVV